MGFRVFGVLIDEFSDHKPGLSEFSRSTPKIVISRVQVLKFGLRLRLKPLHNHNFYCGKKSMRKTNLTGIVKFVFLMTPAPVQDSGSITKSEVKANFGLKYAAIRYYDSRVGL